jgi:membrane associated rhomboid family serine protease
LEAQTEVQNYLEQGKMALSQGKGREAAIAYAHGAQLEADNPLVHLGLAEANMALGNRDVVQMACRRVQELQPEGGQEGWTAQALLELQEKRYDRALKSVDKAIEIDPTIGYLHALRSYLLRATGQDYDANLARARATRLSYGGRFENCFPPLKAPDSPTLQALPNAAPQEQPNASGQAKPEHNAGPNWSQPNRMRRQVIRTRFALSQYPNILTTTLIALDILIYIWMKLDPAVYNFGVQDNNLVLQGQYWRIFTAMFLHDPNDIYHIALNMFSLYFVGRGVEIFYGKWRYLVIYLASGILGGVTFLLLDPNQAAVGASGAIFGIFGALGIFYILNRRALGAYGTGAISQWVFWLVLNLIFGLAPGSDIAIWAHVGGLVAGMIIAYFLIPHSSRGKRVV